MCPRAGWPNRPLEYDGGYEAIPKIEAGVTPPRLSGRAFGWHEMKRGRGGVQYEDLVVGDGDVVDRHSTVQVVYTLSLNRGDVIQRDMRYQFCPAERNVIAGLGYGLEGMRVGGRRRIRVGPHLGYREVGVAERVPANAVLIFEVSLLGVQKGEGA